MVLTRRQRVGGFTLAVLGVLLAATFHVQPLCACAGPAHMMLGYHWETRPPEEMAAVLASRYPKSSTEASIREKHAHYFQRYCRPEGKAAVRCVLPYDGSSWRQRHAILTFTFDDERRLVGAQAEMLVRYAWE